MKTLLAACLTLGVVTVAALPQARADVVVGVPGVRLDVGPHERERDWRHREWAQHREWERRHWEAYRERCYYRGC
jgi:hypothetical protein